MPRPSRAQTEVERRVAAAEAGMGKPGPLADPEPSAPLLRLAEAMERVRESILPQPGVRMTAEERALRGETAARQREVLHDQRRAITAAVLRGQLDPQQAGAASKLIDGCVDDVKWFAERLARDDWGERRQQQDEQAQASIPVKDLLQAAFDLAALHGISMQPARGSVLPAIEGEARVLPDPVKP